MKRIVATFALSLGFLWLLGVLLLVVEDALGPRELPPPPLPP